MSFTTTSVAERAFDMVLWGGIGRRYEELCWVGLAASNYFAIRRGRVPGARLAVLALVRGKCQQGSEVLGMPEGNVIRG